MDECKHDHMQDIVKDNINREHYICCLCETDFGDPIERIVKLQKAWFEIIEECPNPKLPYGIRVVEIAKKALEP